MATFLFSPEDPKSDSWRPLSGLGATTHSTFSRAFLMKPGQQDLVISSHKVRVGDKEGEGGAVSDAWDRARTPTQSSLLRHAESLPLCLRAWPQLGLGELLWG